jgi:hypothetical protein
VGRAKKAAGKAQLIPLLTPIWPLPDDLCHAAGVGTCWLMLAESHLFGSMVRRIDALAVATG